MAALLRVICDSLSPDGCAWRVGALPQDVVWGSQWLCHGTRIHRSSSSFPLVSRFPHSVLHSSAGLHTLVLAPRRQTGGSIWSASRPFPFPSFLEELSPKDARWARARRCPSEGLARVQEAQCWGRRGPRGGGRWPRRTELPPLGACHLSGRKRVVKSGGLVDTRQPAIVPVSGWGHTHTFF